MSIQQPSNHNSVTVRTRFRPDGIEEYHIDQQPGAREIRVISTRFTPNGIERQTYYKNILTMTMTGDEIPKIVRPIPPPKHAPIKARTPPENLRESFNSDEDNI